MQDGCCVGVAVQAGPERLVATVRFLAKYTRPWAQVVLIGDGADTETTQAMTAVPELAALPRCGWTEPAGMPACFNALVERTSAGTVVLLESGVLVGPRWLELLLGALRRPGCGLAGPSTNLSWNEQAAFPNARADESAIRRDAAIALRRFGVAARTLDPLYSLADFCYAVRRDVIDTIGLAEVGYGAGPCWEMDYNVRAARAGFSGVWVGASYVYRSPPAPERRAAEAAQMEASRRLFQDRFCGLRLLGLSSSYRRHCEGDACEHFAPPALLPPGRQTGVGTPAAPVPVARPPLAPPSPQVTPLARAAPTGTPAILLAPSARAGISDSAAPVTSRASVPAAAAHPRVLVSCVMPTRDRTDFALHAVRCFQRQDYRATELVIVEDGPPALASALPGDPRIRLVTSEMSRSIGALRNIACQEARGDILIQWDDDDWHGPQRISRQISGIRDGSADITALRDATIFDLPEWRFWRWSPRLHRQMFVRDVHGGTLAFRRHVWQRLARYPDRSLAEDAAFLDQAVRRGARLRSLSAEGLFIYVRHGTNSWRLNTRPGGGWHAVAEPEFPAADREFYAGHSLAAPFRPHLPLVSCIMPTADRRPFIAKAIEYFRRQDYPAKELVIVDDGEDGVADLAEGADVRYHRLDRRVVLGAKRNLACELASGDFIAHFDDDDWYAPGRLSTQIGRLLDSGTDLSGVLALPFYDGRSRKAWRYEWPGGKRNWAAGSSLCYRKDLWTQSAFPEVATGEDSRFVWSKGERSMSDVSDTNSLVAIIHRRNTVLKNVHGAHWHPVAAENIERLLGGDLDFYHRAEVTR
jgi:O-antigen biosynthesis protein